MPRRGSEYSPEEPSTRPPSPPLDLSGYWSLPGELQRQIVIAACDLHPFYYRSRGQGSPERKLRPQLCRPTTLALAAAGRHFYTLTMPLLLNEVRLTRPSALRAFQAMLASRPALGRLVKRLHIGEEGPMHDEWYPLERYDHEDGDDIKDGLRFRVSLDTAMDQRNNWCYKKEFCTEGNDFDSIGQAMRTAIDAAARDIDIGLQTYCHSRSGCSIGLDAWYIRLFEVQAALEIYCLAIGGGDDETDGPSSRGGMEDGRVRYPRLVVRSEARQSSEEEDNVLVVTRSQVYRRMARAGCDLDDFGHPILFARSGLPWFGCGPEDVTHHGGSSTWRVDEAEDFGDIFALSTEPSHLAPAPDAARVPADLCNALDPILNSAATVASCLALARSLLSLTPLVQRLSLTGFFERAVAGLRSPPSLLALHSLTLGPSAVSWNIPLQLDHPALHSLKELRLCASDLVCDELDSLAGTDGAFPELEKLRWSTVETFRLNNSIGVVAAVDRLLGVDRKAIAEGNLQAISPKAARKKRKALDGSSSDRWATLVEAFLHPRDIDAILQAAPSDEVRAAWTEGKAVRGIRHRLRVEPHSGWLKEHASGREYDNSMQAMYDEGIEWWEGD